jgi:hypothetical protein
MHALSGSHPDRRSLAFKHLLLGLALLGLLGPGPELSTAAEAGSSGVVLAGDFEDTLEFKDGQGRILGAGTAQVGGKTREFVPGVEGSALKIYGTHGLAIPPHVLPPGAGTLSFWLKRTPAATAGNVRPASAQGTCRWQARSPGGSTLLGNVLTGRVLERRSFQSPYSLQQ